MEANLPHFLQTLCNIINEMKYHILKPLSFAITKLKNLIELKIKQTGEDVRLFTNLFRYVILPCLTISRTLAEIKL